MKGVAKADHTCGSPLSRWSLRLVRVTSAFSFSPRQGRRSGVSWRACAAWPSYRSACLALTAASAQTPRAPQIDSITAAEMRADLFFLASDAMQGRLTDTPENAHCRDWVCSRFERLGLEPGGQDGAFDHRYALMTASLGDGQRAATGDCQRAGDSCRAAPRGRLLPASHQRERHRAKAPVVFAGFGIVSPERGHDDYRDAVKREHRARPRSRTRRQRSGERVRRRRHGRSRRNRCERCWRRRRRARSASSSSKTCTIRPGSVELRAQAANYWPPTPPRMERYTLKAWSDRVRIPVMQVSVPAAERSSKRRGGRSLDLARSAEARGGVTPVRSNAHVAMTTQRPPPDRARSHRSSR